MIKHNNLSFMKIDDESFSSDMQRNPSASEAKRERDNRSRLIYNQIIDEQINMIMANLTENN